MNNHEQLIPCNIVILGGNGNLAVSKLLPALYFLSKDNILHDSTRITAAGRSPLSVESYLDLIKPHISETEFSEADWQNFISRIDYTNCDAEDSSTFQNILTTLGEDFNQRLTIYYLSTPPDLFESICKVLDEQGLVKDDSRIVLEKPLGTDLESSTRINQVVDSIFDENRVYRIDHYLGKETVQNLLALRFANALFEPVWSNTHIKNVQITVAETAGIEGRWGYYDESGALRDMVQNHLLQLLCLTAMGVPVSLDADSVRAEKIKVLKSLSKITPETVNQKVIRGQYSAGSVNGKTAVAYTEESGGNNKSQTESFIALRADIHNWRWKGVPFYLRTGKRMPQRYSEIVIEFKDVPHSIFPSATTLHPNKLVIRLQPHESIRLYKMNKVPGLSVGMKLLPVTLDLTLPDSVSETRVPEAYERLFYDLMHGDSTLFVHRDEVEAAWSWCDAIRESWQINGSPPLSYRAGSWGPQAAFELVARYGDNWHESEL